jgi:hypothetical protein
VTRHETDYFSLAAGALFTFLGVAFTVALLGDWNLDIRWAFPLTLIVLGVGGVAASLSAGRTEQDAFDAAQAERDPDLGAGTPTTGTGTEGP